MSRLIMTGLLLMVIAMKLHAQTPSQAMTRLNKDYPVEKLYIHYDKEYYVAGETIWFKCYLENDGLPGSGSTTLYLQMRDDQGNLIANQKYPVRGAGSNGQIQLPDSLPQGNYFIRAFTAGMLNYGNDFIYNQRVYVLNPYGKRPVQEKPSSNISVQFFPESGHLLPGILSVVGFKVTNSFGEPVEAEGILKMDDGTVVCSFKTVHDGMGRLQFKPRVGKIYKAEIKTAGVTSTFNFPEVSASGINLHVENEKGGKLFLLTKVGGEQSSFDRLMLVAQINNRIVYDAEINFEDYPSVRGHLITDSLPSGILQFTVFSQQGIPLAERLSFVNNGEYLSGGQIINGQEKLQRRSKYDLSIQFPDSFTRSMSISIRDAALTSNYQRDNIISSFLLSSDLKGYIHGPTYYFQTQSDSVSLAMDNLMLIQGWTRFDWKKIMAGQFPDKAPVDNEFLRLKGQVNDDQDRASIAGGQLSVYAESEDSSSQNLEIPVTSGGSFNLDSLQFYGKTKFFYAFTNYQKKKRNVKLHIEEVANQRISSAIESNEKVAALPVYPINLSRNDVGRLYDEIKSSKDNVKELERVILQSNSNKKSVEQVNEKYSSGVFREMGQVNIDNINQPANDKSMNVLDYIRNRVQQVELQKGGFVSRKNFSLGNKQNWAVGIFLDEIATDASALRTIRIDDVALIKYYDAGFVGAGSSYPGGAIAVYSKKREGEKTNDNLEHFIVNGYTVSKRFYHPDYSRHGGTEVPDRRTTLYWEPNLLTSGATNRMPISFYSNDSSKKLLVVVEGVDSKGRLVHLEKILE